MWRRSVLWSRFIHISRICNNACVHPSEQLAVHQISEEHILTISSITLTVKTIRLLLLFACKSASLQCHVCSGAMPNLPIKADSPMRKHSDNPSGASSHKQCTILLLCVSIFQIHSNYSVNSHVYLIAFCCLFIAKKQNHARHSSYLLK